VTKDTGWDHALKVTGSGEGLVGHAGAMLLRKLADRAGLTAALGPALGRSGRFPLVDRGVALVDMAVAIALGATSINDIALRAGGYFPEMGEANRGGRAFWLPGTGGRWSSCLSFRSQRHRAAVPHTTASRTARRMSPAAVVARALRALLPTMTTRITLSTKTAPAIMRPVAGQPRARHRCDR
jgi:hypothetical protein